jgi:hypothetical protein
MWFEEVAIELCLMAASKLPWRFAVMPRCTFFETRKALVKHRGTLDDELFKSQKLWLAFLVGKKLSDTNILKQGKIEKLILHSPNYRELKFLAEMEHQTEEELQTDIKRATRLAQENGISIKWCEKPMLSIIISDPYRSSGWFRIEEFIPYLGAANSPSFLVKATQFETLFHDTCKSFERFFDSDTIEAKL